LNFPAFDVIGLKNFLISAAIINFKFNKLSYMVSYNAFWIFHRNRDPIRIYFPLIILNF
jgi:hypothetical protein